MMDQKLCRRCLCFFNPGDGLVGSVLCKSCDAKFYNWFNNARWQQREGTWRHSHPTLAVISDAVNQFEYWTDEFYRKGALGRALAWCGFYVNRLCGSAVRPSQKVTNQDVSAYLQYVLRQHQEALLTGCLLRRCQAIWRKAGTRCHAWATEDVDGYLLCSRHADQQRGVWLRTRHGISRRRYPQTFVQGEPAPDALWQLMYAQFPEQWMDSLCAARAAGEAPPTPAISPPRSQMGDFCRHTKMTAKQRRDEAKAIAAAVYELGLVQPGELLK